LLPNNQTVSHEIQTDRFVPGFGLVHDFNIEDRIVMEKKKGHYKETNAG
jgi:hypothetical protein